MNSYSKINEVAHNKSRSMNFADIFPSETQEPVSHASPKDPENTQQGKQFKEASGSKDSEKKQDIVGELKQGHEVGKLGGNFDVKLSRNSSVSAASTSFQYSLKRAFSMRRSSSVSERYCRIHDQCVVLPSSIEDDEELGGGGGGGLETLDRAKSMRKKKQNKKNKFIHACKKILGL